MTSRLGYFKKFFALPPQDMLLRAQAELGARWHRCEAGECEKRLREREFLGAVQAGSLTALHERIIAKPMPWAKSGIPAGLLAKWAPQERQRVLESAAGVTAGWINLLGSGPVKIADGANGEIEWLKDYKSGLHWPFTYFADLDPSDLERNSDVKFPWELSRLQWLIPLAQAWLLTREERYSRHVRKVLEHWMERNPYAWGINWACTMEPAMRSIVWCWLYTVLADAPGWQDEDFRSRLLRTLYLHLLFVRRFIEITDVNGNHLTADAAALVVGGSFFGGGLPKRWQATGWRLLRREIQLQVYPDGVDFEGSTAYHRLVAELFHFAAAAIDCDGDPIPDAYRDRLLKMADYTEAYTRLDGLAPVIGDNDDARVLPLGGQEIRDHRYLPALIRRWWAPESLTDEWQENAAQCLWCWGNAPKETRLRTAIGSRRFVNGGICILRSERDYVFFSCGQLGLAQRGGHSHNDVLSFEAMLDGCSLIVDAGCFVYTADYEARNKFRSTSLHNTPQVAGEEINRFISPRNLWFLHADAVTEIRQWRDCTESAFVCGSHTGYKRLEIPTVVVRSLSLDKTSHALTWTDALEPDAGQALRVPLQLDPRVQVIAEASNGLIMACVERRFRLSWMGTEAWSLSMEDGVVAPRYGVAVKAPRLVWTRTAGSSGDLRVDIRPVS